jgi:hypothetical protein
MIAASGKIERLELSVDGTPLTVLDYRVMGFTLAGQAYSVRRTGVLSALYELAQDGQVAAAAHEAPFVNRAAFAVGTREWTLKAENLSARRYGLYAGKERVGGIARTGWFKGTVTVDLPDELPVAAQVFLIWLVARKWADATSSG